METGQFNRAFEELTEFVQKVELFVSDGALDPGQAQPLLDAATAIIQLAGPVGPVGPVGPAGG